MGPICLPDPARDYDNVKALVTGWGRLKSGGQLPDILQEVNVTTMTNQQCRGKYGKSRITDYMICAGDVGRDSCQGDSGGPLSVLGQDDRYSQIGIVSWGEGCAKPGYPGVYTRLTSLLDWVNQPQPTTPGADVSDPVDMRTLISSQGLRACIFYCQPLIIETYIVIEFIHSSQGRIGLGSLG